VLGPAQTDAFGAELEGELRVARAVGVRADVEVLHERAGQRDEVEQAEVFGSGSISFALPREDGRFAVVGHVEGDVVALVDRKPAQRRLLPANDHVGANEGNLAVLARDDEAWAE
jgi:hypothetical protein